MTSQPASQSPTDYKLQLGALLQELRKQAGKERRDAADKLGCTEATIGTYERGRSAPGPTQLPLLLELYKVDVSERPDILELGQMARKRTPRGATFWGAPIPDRLKKFFNIEAASRGLRHYHPKLIHGLAQTEDCARAIISLNPRLTSAEIDRLIDGRMTRRLQLTGADPLEFQLVLDEGVIRVPVGGAKVMRAQLLHLVDMIEDRVADIRVIPFGAGMRRGQGAGFSIFDPKASARKRVVYLEHLTDGVWIDDDARVAEYESVFGGLHRAALPPKETVDLLAKVAVEL